MGVVLFNLFSGCEILLFWLSAFCRIDQGSACVQIGGWGSKGSGERVFISH